MSVAVTSLPVPLSPVMRTVLSLLPITRRNSNTARMRALLPTTIESIGSITGVMAGSDHPQRFEFGDFLPKCGFNAEIQRHVRARASGTQAGELDVGRIAVDINEEDVAAVRVHERTHAVEDRFHAFSGNHADSEGNSCASTPAPKSRRTRGFSPRATGGSGDY